MSIKAMRQAFVALEHAVPKDMKQAKEQIDAIQALLTAIQQAESEPAGEPRARVEIMKTGGNAGLSTRIIELDIATRERLRPGDLLYTHPAPGVPAGYVSVPVQVLRDASEALGNFVSDHGWGDADMQAMDNLDAYIARHDARAQKGQP